MQGIFQKENTDKALKYGIYRHLPTYEKIIRNLVSFFCNKTIVQDGWLYRNGFLRKNCKIRLTDITQMKRKKNLFGEALILYKNQKKIAKISARNRNVDWLQVKIAEIKKDKKKLERKK